MENDKRGVRVLGTLGCQNCQIPYHIVEIKVVKGASRRFLFVCSGCDLGLRITASHVYSIRYMKEEKEDGE